MIYNAVSKTLPSKYRLIAKQVSSCFTHSFLSGNEHSCSRVKANARVRLAFVGCRLSLDVVE